MGTVKFTSANGEVKSGNIWHDQEGGVWYAYAEQTLWMPYWKRTVTAELVATNDFWAYSEQWRVRVLALGTARQTQTLWYESANYHLGGGGPIAVGTNLYMGDLGGNSYRTFTKQNYPAKPDPGAYCVGVYAYFSTLIASSLIRVGFHILWPLAPVFKTFRREEFLTFPFLDFSQPMIHLHNPFRPASVTPAS